MSATPLQIFTDSPYSLEHFKDFIQGIFPNAQPLNLPKIPYDREIIKSYTQVCNDIELDSGNILQVYAFETQHLRAKITLHKELGAIAKSQASHILACFYDESNPSEFRLSLITTGFENGKQTHSSPSRQSFVLGDSIPTHTAKKQLSSLLHPHSPHSKESLESAFSVEPVSKEFYEAISSHFLDFLDSLALPAISTDSDYENTKREFALRLFCRVLFCKFLEKKGLIDSGIFDTNLSQNYYHEVLEPLFFSTLNTHKDHRDYAHLPAQVAVLLDSIPYLNGGLFAPQASDFYDSKEPFANIVQLKIPNACFAKLFETLRLYHFTLDENTPESKEVGLDPELLGMVFENLLSVLFTDNRLENAQSLRKKTGSYYTPREIVSYMCKNTLFQALLSKLGDLPLGDHLADCENLGAVITEQVTPTPKSPQNSHSHTANTRIAETNGAKSLECQDSTHSSLRVSEANAAIHSLESKIDCHALSSDKARNDGSSSDLAQKPTRESSSVESKTNFANQDSGSPESKGDFESIDSSDLGQSPKRQDSGDKNGALRDEARARTGSSVTEAKSKQSPFLAQKPTRESSDSKICDEKCGLQGKSQGSYLSGNDCRDFSPLPHLSRKAESHADLHALVFDKHATESLLQSKAQILATLNSLKILDPACGSGAFPLGILQEILEIQEALGDTRALYERKLAILQSNIYGIDIQPMATEISRLRCFLSLIVDESSHSIDPLPNLEFKFISANSLLPLPQTTTLEYDGYQADREKLDSIRASTFSAPAESKLELKERYQKQASKIAQSLILSGEGESALTRWDPYDPHSVAEFFDSGFMFGFSHFDIVIGNPPYIGEKGHRELFAPIKASGLGRFYQGKMDLFYFFFHQGLELLKGGGILAFITTNYYPTALGGRKLREDFKARAHIFELINFNEYRIFNSAQGQHNMITFLQKQPLAESSAPKPTTIYTHIHSPDFKARLDDMLSALQNPKLFCKATLAQLYEGTESYMRITPTLEGALDSTGAQSIFTKLTENAALLGEICHINTGIQSGADKVTQSHLSKYDWEAKGYQKGDGIYILSTQEAKDKGIESSVLKPCFKNSDISRYTTALESTQKVLYLTGNENPNDIPNTIKHLQDFRENLESRREVHKGSRVWWALWWARKSEIFTPAKIVCPQRSRRNTFGYNNIPWYAMTDVFFITQKDSHYELLYILALLNSKLYYFWLYHKGKRKGEILELIQAPLSQIPIKPLSIQEQQPFITLVEKILESKRADSTADTTELESKIDSLIYALYGLNEQEIELIANYDLQSHTDKTKQGGAKCKKEIS